MPTDTHAQIADLHEQLDRVEGCARQEYGKGTRIALTLSLISVVRGLLREVEALRQEPR